ncbi:MAG: hypothetical protein ACRDGV_04660, partial [Candidatus Limnocylindria bacterium]
DPFYAQEVESVAFELGLQVVVPAWTTRHGGSFYARSAAAVWRDVLSARPPVDDALRQTSADRLVVGNDWGLIEKLVLHRSVFHGIQRRILVQDGRLTDVELRASTVSQRAVQLAKRGISPFLRRAQLPYLGASRYGESGVEVICATGPKSADLLGRRSAGRSRVLVTGQPRYDRLRSFLRDRAADRLRSVVAFTTPFEAAGLGSAPQIRQHEAISSIASLLAARDIRLTVKPHPREEPERYARLVGADHVTIGDPAAVMAGADLAIIGISTLIEEAGLLGCPVIVPGALIHGAAFDAALPDQAIYPRFDDPAGADALLTGLNDASARADLASRQAAVIIDDVAFSQERPAAALVADAILGV